MFLRAGASDEGPGVARVPTYSKEGLFIGVTFDIHPVKADNTKFLEFVGTRVDMQVGSMIYMNKLRHWQRISTLPPKDKPPLVPGVLASVCENEQVSPLCRTIAMEKRFFFPL